MNAPDALPGINALTPEGMAFHHEVAARVVPSIATYRPGRVARRVRTPILFCVSDTDAVAPAARTLRHARTARRGEIRRSPGGHFDFYSGDTFEAVVNDQLTFLEHHLGTADVPPPTSKEERFVKAYVIDRYKSPVRAADVLEPEIGSHDVLVDIHANGINPLDARIRDGDFKLFLPYRMPLTLGNDMAGVVTQVGTGVTRFAVGDEVYARPDKARIGTFVERIAIHQDDLALKPTRLSMAEAAALPLVGLAAWQALVERANVQPGQRVLIHAGSGGLGAHAIQLAKHLGATVATTTGTANTDWVRELGAEVVIDYKTQDFESVVHDYDVVLDT